MPDESNPNEGSHGRELDKDGELSHGKIAEPSTETKAAEAEDLKEVTQDNKEEKEKTEDNRSTAAETTQETPPNSERSSAWLNWFPRPKSDPNDSSKEDKAQTQTWEVDKAEQSDSQPKPEADQETGDKPAVEAGHTTHVDTTPSTRPKRTWLQTLTSTSPASHEKKASDAVDPSQETQKPVDNTSEPIQSNETVNSSPENAENVGDTKRTGHTAKPSSGWIFWSRERPTQESGGDDGQSSEEPATRDISTEQKIAPTTKVDQPRESQQSTKEVKKQTKKAVAHGPPTDDAVPAEPSPFDSTAESGTEPAKPTKPSATRKTQLLPNQLLPSVKKTFPTKRRPSLIQQLNRWLYSNNSSQPKHVALAREPPRVKKALAIGIHGYFPAPLIRTVLGQPTGTSVKFSDQAAKAISEWADSHDNPCEVEKISLEGEGRIEERLELLWKLLLNWIEHIRTADFIMVACHSQGVPVATMLVAKLIAFGCVNSARIGICAMAGVNLGLFPDYKSRWISGSAGELFDFADSTSEVSKEYLTALKTVLDFGVRITYVGSIDDQLVSLEVRCILLYRHAPLFVTYAATNYPHSLRHLHPFPIPIFTEPYSSMGECTHQACMSSTLAL